MVLLLYPGLYGIIIVHIRREKMQKETFLQFQAFSLDELLCALKHPEESEELVHYSTARTKTPLFLLSPRFNNGLGPHLHHAGVDFTTEAEE